MLARSTGPYEGLPEAGILTPDNEEQLSHFRSYVATGTTDVGALAAAVGTTEETGTLQMRTAVARGGR